MSPDSPDAKDDPSAEDSESLAIQKGLSHAINETVFFRDFPEGTKIRLRTGEIAEITANPRDGGWLFIRIVESDDPARVGHEDMAYLLDVVGVV